MSAWELPTTVEVAGRSFAIRSDFRAVLDALAALTDPDLTQQEQYVACLQILYPRWKELPDANAALRAAFTFIELSRIDIDSNTEELELLKIAGSIIGKLRAE